LPLPVRTGPGSFCERRILSRTPCTEACGNAGQPWRVRCRIRDGLLTAQAGHEAGLARCPTAGGLQAPPTLRTRRRRITARCAGSRRPGPCHGTDFVAPLSPRCRLSAPSSPRHARAMSRYASNLMGTLTATRPHCALSEISARHSDRAACPHPLRRGCTSGVGLRAHSCARAPWRSGGGWRGQTPLARQRAVAQVRRFRPSRRGCGGLTAAPPRRPFHAHKGLTAGGECDRVHRRGGRAAPLAPPIPSDLAAPPSFWLHRSEQRRSKTPGTLLMRPRGATPHLLGAAPLGATDR
jgi:hypothetical protein